jgi:pseudouridine-5'-phosphate glycosidase
VFLKVAPEIRRAQQGGRPMVALKSAIITHGMPYPPAEIAAAMPV